MSVPRHEEEVDANLEVWRRKPLLRGVYARLYDRVEEALDRSAGPVVEVGSGIGSLAESVGGVITTDAFVRPWLDLALDAYSLPLRERSVGNVVAVDVLHHLSRPMMFLQEVHRVLSSRGRLILLEPYISAAGWIAYGCFHDEPVAWSRPIDWSTEKPGPGYYAAQGNATRLFFGKERHRWAAQWQLLSANAFASFAYLLSGGFSRPAFYPPSARPLAERADELLSRWPALFGARALVVLQPR